MLYKLDCLICFAATATAVRPERPVRLFKPAKKFLINFKWMVYLLIIV